jgi:DtxR family Mn-dependent transcriptional regulator
MNWVFVALILVLVVLIPRYGLLALYQERRRTRQRERVEDALKHLLDREGQARHASPESLAGILNLPCVEVTRLIAEMESQNLLETRGSEIHLTAEGERWAIHIARAHRLWERYLAVKWATVSVVITLGIAFLVTFLTASFARSMGWA